jgi:hypothetical protein
VECSYRMLFEFPEMRSASRYLPVLARSRNSRQRGSAALGSMAGHTMSGLWPIGEAATFPIIVLMEDRSHVPCRDGARLSMKDRVEQGRRVADKFHALAEPVLGRSRTNLLVSLVEKMEISPIGAIAGACA